MCRTVRQEQAQGESQRSLRVAWMLLPLGHKVLEPTSDFKVQDDKISLTIDLRGTDSRF